MKSNVLNFIPHPSSLILPERERQDLNLDYKDHNLACCRYTTPPGIFFSDKQKARCRELLDSGLCSFIKV